MYYTHMYTYSRTYIRTHNFFCSLRPFPISLIKAVMLVTHSK